MCPNTAPSAPPRNWTFLSNHAHVLVCLASDPDARLRDVAARVGITERAVQKIVGDLERPGLGTQDPAFDVVGRVPFFGTRHWV